MLDIDLNFAPIIASDATDQPLNIPTTEKPDAVTNSVTVKSVVKKQQKYEGRLQLLIEAAKYVEGYETEKLSLKRCRNKGKEMEVVYKEEEGEVERVEDDVALSAPVVRSKRGRTQVLPNKYRDSVMEPLLQQTRPYRSEHVPTKRRSR